jgi:hypothetical protein
VQSLTAYIAISFDFITIQDTQLYFKTKQSVSSIKRCVRHDCHFFYFRVYNYSASSYSMLLTFVVKTTLLNCPNSTALRKNSRSLSLFIFHFPLTYEYVFITQQNVDCYSNSPLDALSNLLTSLIIPSLTSISIWKTAGSGRDRREHLTALTVSTWQQLYSLILSF